MAYNSAWVKQKSINLENLDCSLNVKHVPQDDTFLEGIFTASATKVVGVGECVAMIRVGANTIIMGAELYWNDPAPAAVVAIGDPYACARILGPVAVGTPRGVITTSTCSGFIAHGTCGTLMKFGREGDGCGVGYRYTCETDIVLTNLYTDANATIGGWQGSSTVAGSQASTAINAGTYYLVLQVKKATSLT